MLNEAVLLVREAVWDMHTPDDLEQVLEAIRQALDKAAMPFFSCSISVVEGDAESPTIQFWATTRKGRWLKEELESDSDHPVLALMRRNEPVYRPDLDQDDPFNEKAGVQAGYGQPIRCLLDMPYALGTLSLSSLEPDAFSQDHTRFLQMLAPYFESAIRRSRDLRELKRHNRELERLNKELDSFSSAASHDLRAPIRRISQSARSLKGRHRTDPAAKTDQALDTIIGQAEGMRELVDHLLSYARAGRSKDPLVPVDLANAAQRARQALADTIAEKRARIEIGPLPWVWGHPVALAQLFQNLIENGLKYQEGAPPEIGISAERHGDAWKVAVKDNGIGIEPQYAEQVFESFKRLHNEDKYPGTGLGLATCQRIVASHGGELWVESAPGQGSAFYCTLKDAPAERAGRPPGGVAPRALRILLAEDDPSSRLIAKSVLEQAGHSVVAASDGEEAVETYLQDAQAFDLLLLDMHMPLLDGPDVLRRVRRHQEEQSADAVPVVALTGSHASEEQSVLAMGFDGFLTKPLQKDRLRETLGRLAERRA